jgi:hypothetical protein
MVMNNLYRPISDFYEMKYGHHAIADCCIFINFIQSVLLNEKAKRIVPFNARC